MSSRFLRYSVGVCAPLFVLVGLAMLAGRAGALIRVVSPWLQYTNPSIYKVLDLPSNTTPRSINHCQPNAFSTDTSRDRAFGCAVLPVGVMNSSNQVVASVSPSSPVLPIIIKSPLTMPLQIPNSKLTMSLTNNSTSKLRFYTNYLSSLTEKHDSHFKPYLYLGSDPDVTPKTAGGSDITINTDQYAFSANGEWMVASTPSGTFFRMDLSDFSTTPFAGWNSSMQTAQLTISNDGQFVGLYGGSPSTLQVYDFGWGCTYADDVYVNNAPTTPYDNLELPKVCSKSMDYMPFLNSQINAVHGLAGLHFANSTTLGFDAVYNYKSSTDFDVGRYDLAPNGAYLNGSLGYLGLGDSFTSGEGAFDYVAGTDTADNTCHLSAKSYPIMISQKLFDSGTSVACSGAKTNDIITLKSYSGQASPKKVRTDSEKVPFLENFSPGYIKQGDFVATYQPRVITVSVGGNDIGLKDIILACVKVPASTCYATYNDRLKIVNRVDALYDTLSNPTTGVYARIKAASPNSTIYAISYPEIASDTGSCGNNVQLNHQEVLFANQLADYLDWVTQQAALRAGVNFVDVNTALYGHQLCDPNPAINGVTSGKDSGIGPLKFLGSESFHPTAYGQQLLENDILDQTDDLNEGMPWPDNSVQAPTPKDAAILLENTPKDDSKFIQQYFADDMSDDVLVLNKSEQINLGGSTSYLQSASAYNIQLHSDPIDLGGGVTDADGNIGSSFTIPAGTAPGFHELHIYGTGTDGKPVDIVKTVFVATSEDSAAQEASLCGDALSSNDTESEDALNAACSPSPESSEQTPANSTPTNIFSLVNNFKPASTFAQTIVSPSTAIPTPSSQPTPVTPGSKQKPHKWNISILYCLVLSGLLCGSSLLVYARIYRRRM